MEPKMSVVKQQVVTPPQVKRLNEFFMLMGMPDGPPIPNCSCDACKIKSITLGVLTLVGETEFEAIFTHIRENKAPWLSMGVDHYKKQVIEYFEKDALPKLEAALKKIYEEEFGRPVDNDSAKIEFGNIVDKMPDPEFKELGFTMKPGRA